MNKNYYRVKRGDTVLSVSEELSFPPFKLIADNALTEEIRAGQVLIIIKLSRPVYRVKPFDSIEEICEKFCIVKQDFLLNNKTDVIYPGILVYV